MRAVPTYKKMQTEGLATARELKRELNQEQDMKAAPAKRVELEVTPQTPQLKQLGEQQKTKLTKLIESLDNSLEKVEAALKEVAPNQVPSFLLPAGGGIPDR